MAARPLALTAATAILTRIPGIETTNSRISFRCKDFSAVVRLGAAGVRTSAKTGPFVLGFASGKGRKTRSGTQARRRPKSSRIVHEDDEEDVEKAMMELFKQLEIDLNLEDDGGGENEDEFTDEELAQMGKELEAAFHNMANEEDGEEEEEFETAEPGVVDMDLKDGVYSPGSGAKSSILMRKNEEEVEEDDEFEDEFEDEDFVEEDGEGEERMVPLEKWQLQKLAAAVEKGRRNVNVKSLAGELKMDRSDVLAFLRDPPPDLLIMSAQFADEDEAAAAASEEVKAKVENAPKTASSRRQPPIPSGGPSSPRSWHANKRLKKEHIATLERVYRQSSRPSNTMIENLVNLTHVPRKKILQWFDQKRAEHHPPKKAFEDAPES